jgi:RimJ/RimL family protein N-acetyltransferase
LPDLRTPRLLIEPLRPDHARGWFDALGHPAASAFFDQPEVTTLEALRARIDRVLSGPPADRPGERWLNWVVRFPASPDAPVVGRLEATTYGDWGEIAYVFDPRVWGQGLATEATRWLVDHLADQGVPELWACIAPANSASTRLVERLGFELVAGRPPRPLGSYDETDVAYRRLSGPAEHLPG